MYCMYIFTNVQFVFYVAPEPGPAPTPFPVVVIIIIIIVICITAVILAGIAAAYLHVKSKLENGMYAIYIIYVIV